MNIELLNEKIRQAARDVVVAYAHHIKSQVDTKNESYLESGVNDSVSRYEVVFRHVIGKVLGIGIPINPPCPEYVVKDLTNVVQKAMDNTSLSEYRIKPNWKSAIYELCIFVFEKFREHDLKEGSYV